MRPPHAPHDQQVMGRMAAAVMAAHPMKAVTKTDIARHPRAARRQMAKARRKVKATNLRRRKGQAKTASARRPLAVVKAASPPKMQSRRKHTALTDTKADRRRAYALPTIKTGEFNRREQHPRQGPGVFVFMPPAAACWQKYRGQPVRGQPPV